MLDLSTDQLQETVKRSKRNAWSVLNSAPIGICVTNPQGHFELVNPAFCAFYGYAQEELIGQHFIMLLSPENHSFACTQHTEFLGGTETIQARQEWTVYCKNGERRTVLTEAAKVESDDDQQYKVTFVIDITERKKLEERLQEANSRLDHLACHDELTGLLNRRAGLCQLEEELKRCRRYGGELSVVLFDLDSFKSINDTYGHATGDTALAEVTAAIAHALRDTDLQVRLGGEEFLIIMPETGSDEAHVAAERLRAIIEERRFTPHQLSITLSAGVASTPATSAEQLIERGDQAMYQAKASGRNQVSLA
ncbi:diguanylate cyclase [Halomonas sp. GD1P12]|uniref:sensor domain-containing diguanylate cyclase n=1 Tax=Halomonas sp. GD1P12 TaxID=2982691 RepID=UPI0021E49301|nr:diguanylate cyclase [Halomonas sp. GD1P12]UYF99178.1 diguanylate cyclase [Halomonas sp. GD1P12]